jgi:dolichyl-phosphate-mannose--protein O-mannosyl transferase
MNFFKTRLKETLVPLLFCGIFFGLALACKWIALYGGLGLAVIFFTSLGQRACEYIKARRILTTRKAEVPKQQHRQSKAVTDSFFPNTVLTLLWCILVFVLIPAVIYALSYIPFLMVPGPGHGLSNVLTYQEHMYNYHSKLQATHPFSSAWWQWPIIYKPVWCYGSTEALGPGNISSIVIMGNPAVWWIGIPAVAATAAIALHKKENRMYVVLVGVASQYLPWALSPRKLQFIYHFFATVPFMVLCITYVLMNLSKKIPKFKYVIYVYLAIVLALVIMFYPVLSGAVVSKSFVAVYLRWFKSWLFFK